MIDTNEYAYYLLSDDWRQKSKERMKIDGYMCTMCGGRGTALNPLEVHHLTYNNIYNENVFSDLVTLCHCCHKSIHNVMNRVTNEEGRSGWKDNSYIPKIHVYNISGLKNKIGYEEEDHE